jgi:hypothetical protein
LDVPPFGAGFTTVMASVPALSMNLDEIDAVRCAASTNVVCRELPSTCTTAPGRKLVPVTVSVNLSAPADTVLGLNVTSVGPAPTTVTVALVASLVNPSFANSRMLHVAPTVEGDVNVIAALVRPIGGGVEESFRYFLSIYEPSAVDAGQ